MLSLPPTARIYLCTVPADMRKSFDGLCGLIQTWLQGDPLSGEVYVFRNKTGDRIKILTFEGDGLAIFYKELETEDTHILGFTAVGLPAHNRQACIAEAGRVVGVSRKSGPRRSVMPRQGSQSVPPRALRQWG